MSEYPLTLDQIASWLAPRRAALKEFGIVLSNVHESREFLPALFVDLDSARTIGRLTAWVSGEFDFELLRTANGETAFFSHVVCKNLHTDELDAAFTELIEKIRSIDAEEVKPRT